MIPIIERGFQRPACRIALFNTERTGEVAVKSNGGAWLKSHPRAVPAPVIAIDQDGRQNIWFCIEPVPIIALKSARLLLHRISSRGSCRA
ncbi:hypothetical protein ElyMa_001016000 [Elysia marginata]|uniref:Uncharacterized protein n=1 Tax=Elysia marginata TaxID=1093978 RepID=A0AAV4HLT6_9GAST|nr:hypothetical protein ElyMa_001016000 [Elysia marginata]